MFHQLQYLLTTVLFVCLCLLFSTSLPSTKKKNKHIPIFHYDHHVNKTIPPSVIKYESYIGKGDAFTITSMVVDQHIDTNWYIPSFHDKYSAGWNRSVSAGYLSNTLACHVRFFGIGLEKVLQKGFLEGGTGYLVASYKERPDVFKRGRSPEGFRFSKEQRPAIKTEWVGHDTNETRMIHCYFMTNAHYGSHFRDKPQTVGLVVYCPISLDHEIGLYDFNAYMRQGTFCRKLNEMSMDISVILRPSTFEVPGPAIEKVPIKDVIEAKITNQPTIVRRMYIQSIGSDGLIHSLRYHAVCVVQTFRNPQSGPMLSLFVKYYHRLGWR